MNGYVIDIDQATVENDYFRKVLYTAHNCQLVVMSLRPHEDIGEEVHTLDQFIRCEEGAGKSVLGGVEHEFGPGFAVVVPAGLRHNIVNTGETALKLYTVYAPPNHIDGTIHKTKADAVADEEHDHFDGKATE